MSDRRPVLRITFLGKGEAALDGSPLAFPYQKVGVLLFALAEARSLSRRAIRERLWGENSERAAANMRNALSALKRLLPEGFIVASPGSDRVAIAPDVTIVSDLDEINERGVTRDTVVRLARPFLEELNAKKVEAPWAEERRAHYRDRLRQVLVRKEVKAAHEEREYWRAWVEAVEGPGFSRTAPSLPLLVRMEERDGLLAFFCGQRAENGRARCSFAALLGEEGSGKSFLASDILGRRADEGVLCLRARLTESEGNDRASLKALLKGITGEHPAEDFQLPPFYLQYLDAAFRNVPDDGTTGRHALPLVDLNPYLLGRIFALLLAQALPPDRREVFLLLEDIHWGEHLIPIFLRGLFENARVPISVLATSYLESKEALELALSPLGTTVRRHTVVLDALTASQSEALCRAFLPDHPFSAEDLASIHKHTGGRPFLLREFLRHYGIEGGGRSVAQSLRETEQRRRLSLSEDEAKLLDCLAAFPGEAPFEILTKLSEMSDTTVIDLYERLHRKGVVYEKKSGDSFSILFRHALLKRQIREAMPRLKWWNLNKHLVALFTTDAYRDMGRRDLPVLAHNAGDSMTELAARIQDLKVHFEVSHELFPKLSDRELLSAARTTNDTSLTKGYIDEAQELLEKLYRSNGRTPELVRLDRRLMTIKGGFLRWNGDYGSAFACLEEALKLALREPKREEVVVSVLEQLCYIGIQKDDPQTLAFYAPLFYRETLKAHLHPSIGMGLRFLAILNGMEGRYEAASRLAKMSSRLFESLETQGEGYTLGVVAAVHTFGDIALYEGRHEEALGHYLQCIKLCEAKGFYRGMGLQLAKAAWCAVRIGQVEESRQYLLFAQPLFDGFQSQRGVSLCGGEIVFALGALYALRDGQTARAMDKLRSAQELSAIMKKPLWNAIFSCIKATLKECHPGVTDALLPQTASHYRDKAGKLFSQLGLRGERDACEQLVAAMGGSLPGGENRV